MELAGLGRVGLGLGKKTYLLNGAGSSNRFKPVGRVGHKETWSKPDPLPFLLDTNTLRDVALKDKMKDKFNTRII